MKEPLILTVTGRRVNPLHVRPEDVCEEDVAHHLACINRFNGATRGPITVAQHAVYVSRLLDGTGYEWQGLHHDDGEAYVGDVTKWLKESEAMAAFREADHVAQCACYEHFEIPSSEYIAFPDLMNPVVREADKLMVRFEGWRGYGTRLWKLWSDEVTHYAMVTPEEIERVGKWQPWSWKQAKEAWLTRLRNLRLQKRFAGGPTTRTGGG